MYVVPSSPSPFNRVAMGLVGWSQPATHDTLDTCRKLRVLWNARLTSEEKDFIGQGMVDAGLTASQAARLNLKNGALKMSSLRNMMQATRAQRREGLNASANMIKLLRSHTNCRLGLYNCHQRSICSRFHLRCVIRTGAEEGLLSYVALYSTAMTDSDLVQTQLEKALDSVIQPGPSQTEANCNETSALDSNRILTGAGWVFEHDKTRAGYCGEVISLDGEGRSMFLFVCMCVRRLY
jgi:hypothetical protein